MTPKQNEIITETLAESHACYVLITCGEPSTNGKMDVQMTYEGDTSLAGLLIEKAQQIIEERQEEDLIG